MSYRLGVKFPPHFFLHRGLKPGPVFAALFFVVAQVLFGQAHFFWDNPYTLSPGAGSFPQTAEGESFSVVAWQEAAPTATDAGNLFISMAVLDDSANTEEGSIAASALWKIRERVAGPYPYALSDVPSIFNIAIDKKGRIILCIAKTPDTIDMLISRDKGLTFEHYEVRNERGGDAGDADATAVATSESAQSVADILAPKVFCAADGGLLLFVVRNVGQNLTLYYAQSADGITWSPFEPFIRESNLGLNFLPTHISIGTTECVVFQSFIPGAINRPSYQLFLKTSTNGGRTWTASKRISMWGDPGTGTRANPDAFNNERAQLSYDNSGYGPAIFMVWERRFGSGAATVSGARINTQGELLGTLQRINSGDGSCNNPIATLYQGERVVVWFDDRRGSAEQAFIAQNAASNQDASTWPNSELSRFAQTAIFTRMVMAGGKLYLFWQEITDGKSRIIMLAPDITAQAPELLPQNFVNGKRVSSSIARISWTVPYDYSGIRGYSWVWSRNPAAVPPRIIGADTRTTSTSESATEDGNWYFSIIACDNAGNWSPPARITFSRDTTPPPAAAIIPLATDADGFILSNTFAITWNQPPAADLAGYAWDLEFLGPASASDTAIAASYDRYKQNNAKGSASRALRVMGKETAASYVNRDNGVWCFSVFPIDDVGNVGPQSTYVFKMNKYLPHTYITVLNAKQDAQGNLSLDIIGRGFSDGGFVKTIGFRPAGESGTIRTLRYADHDYEIRSDREIFIPDVQNLPAGAYFITVDHPLRGMASSASPITVLRSLTVKFGDFANKWQPEWLKRLTRLFVFSWDSLIVCLIMVFCLALAVLTMRGILFILMEGKAVQIQTLAIMSGELMPGEKKKLASAFKKYGLGLRFKLASFTLALVLIVVLMVSGPLYIQMNRTQRETLMKGLWDRSVVLIEGITASARVYMPSNNVLELGYLPQQSAAIPEARYITITGFGSGNTTTDDYIWASNDPDILKKINTSTLETGVSRLSDSLSDILASQQAEWNQTAQDAIGSIAESITELNREGVALTQQTDAESIAKFENIQVTVTALEQRITRTLDEMASGIQSDPPFNFDDYEKTGNTNYMLYKPILFRQGTSDIYVRGVIRMEISTELPIEQMRQGRIGILRMILYIAVLAMLIGGVGAMALSSIIVRPVRRLVRHVEQIRDTENKADLEGVDITIKSHDEIAVLGNTINAMTHGLVKAAKAAEDLSIGKEIQKKFIPLDIDKDGNKLTSGYKTTKNVRFFGYYEGAKGVSGDYFDYQNIDDRYYAIIKCDVAGKGIPAALIMIQVATMFINYFREWKPTRDGMKIEKLVYQINGFIETLGFKGRFAAFTLCVFDSETGIVRFCNAGDNIIHWFDRSESRLKHSKLPETPATGVLPNSIIEGSSGYKVQTMNLGQGDILLLYTDGIEEAKRKFRDEKFNEIVCSYQDAPNDTPHDTHVVGQGDEEMGPDRVEAIINAVMNKEVYSLYKYHNPAGEVEYHFDFTGCTGSVEELIMAMVSVEKVFRMYKPSTAGADSRILVDSKVDSFLKDHFREYNEFCANTQAYPDSDSYIYYTAICEDEQYDDLTILGINRK